MAQAAAECWHGEHWAAISGSTSRVAEEVADARQAIHAAFRQKRFVDP
jgi:hypothetical protein